MAEPAPEAPPPGSEEDKRIVHTYPLVEKTDMPEEMYKEIAEIAVTACEKHQSNYEHAAKYIKLGMEQRFGTPWNAVVGEAFAYDVEYYVGSILLMYTAGKIACLMWKAPSM